jgi:hypothetical protein
MPDHPGQNLDLRYQDAPSGDCFRIAGPFVQKQSARYESMNPGVTRHAQTMWLAPNSPVRAVLRASQADGKPAMPPAPRTSVIRSLLL